jgi:hypothetical protein
VSEAEVVRAKTSVEMTQDLMNEKRRKISLLEEYIHEKVIPAKREGVLILEPGIHIVYDPHR